jgi:hypothetical protein
MATKEYKKEYLNLCEGINVAVSDELMREGELKHSTNATSAKIGLLEKVAGQELFWDLQSANEIQGIKQLGTTVFGLIKNGANADLYKKGAGTTDKTLVLASLMASSPLEVALDHIFYIKSDKTLGAYDGTNLSTAKHILNAPAALDNLKSAGGLLYAQSGNKIYVSSPPRRIVATVVGDHITGSTTINVSSTRYIRTGNVLEIWAINGGSAKMTVTVTAVPNSTSFTCAATGGALTNGDEIYYQNLRAVDVFMWNDDPRVGSWYWANSDDGQPTALCEQLGTLVELHPQSTWRFDQSRRDNIALTGTTLTKTADTINGVVYFANSDNIHSITRNTPAPVGDKVLDYLKNATDITKFRGTSDGRYYRLFIGNTAYRSLSGVEIIFDTENQKYDTRSGRDITVYGNMVISNKRNCYVGTSDGKVLKLGVGTSNNGTNIAFEAETKRDSLGDPDTIKLFEKVVIRTTPGSIFDVYVSIDGGGYTSIGQTTQEVQSFEINERGIDIAVFVTETSSDQTPVLKSIKIYATADEEV